MQRLGGRPIPPSQPYMKRKGMVINSYILPHKLKSQTERGYYKKKSKLNKRADVSNLDPTNNSFENGTWSDYHNCDPTPIRKFN